MSERGSELGGDVVVVGVLEGARDLLALMEGVGDLVFEGDVAVLLVGR